MAKYKLLATSGYPQLEIGEVYEENKILASPDITVLHMADRYPEDWQLVKDRKIIGYKLKDECIDYDQASCQICNGVSVLSSYMISRELYPNVISKLEKAGVLDLRFNPVYESTYPDITINGYVVEFFDEHVKFGYAKIDKNVFLRLFIDLKVGDNNPFPFSNKEIESVTIGKGTFTKDQIKQVAEYYINKK